MSAQKIHRPLTITVRPILGGIQTDRVADTPADRPYPVAYLETRKY
jgi:hypothetical protein